MVVEAKPRVLSTEYLAKESMRIDESQVIKRPFTTLLLQKFRDIREWLKVKQFELEFAEADDDNRRLRGGYPWPGYLTVCRIIRNIPF